MASKKFIAAAVDRHDEIGLQVYDLGDDVLSVITGLEEIA
jgi:hypothetical protein